MVQLALLRLELDGAAKVIDRGPGSVGGAREEHQPLHVVRDRSIHRGQALQQRIGGARLDVGLGQGAGQR